MLAPELSLRAMRRDPADESERGLKCVCVEGINAFRGPPLSSRVACAWVVIARLGRQEPLMHFLKPQGPPSGVAGSAPSLGRGPQPSWSAPLVPEGAATAAIRKVPLLVQERV